MCRSLEGNSVPLPHFAANLPTIRQSLENRTAFFNCMFAPPRQPEVREPSPPLGDQVCQSWPSVQLNERQCRCPPLQLPWSAQQTLYPRKDEREAQFARKDHPESHEDADCRSEFQLAKLIQTGGCKCMQLHETEGARTAVPCPNPLFESTAYFVHEIGSTGLNPT